jgi:hypothetical protein
VELSGPRLEAAFEGPFMAMANGRATPEWTKARLEMEGSSMEFLTFVVHRPNAGDQKVDGDLIPATLRG